MTVTLRLPPPSVRPVLKYSSLLEAALSIHVLSLPKQHALQLPWVRACRDLSPELRQELRAFRFFFGEGIAGLFLHVNSGSDFRDELARVAAADDATVVADFQDFIDPAQSMTVDPEAQPLADLLESEPSTFLRRLVAMLERYWEEAFSAEWDRIEPTIALSLGTAADRLARQGEAAFFASFPDQVRFDGDTRVLSFERPFESEIDVGERPMTITPSVYAWPHVMVTIDDRDPPLMIYPIASLAVEAPPTPPPDLMKILRLLADDTRLLLLRLLSQRPHSTQELAALTYRSEPTVSRHLSQLAEAGLLEGRREGYYVVYEVRQDRLEPLSDALMGFIRAS